MRVTLEILARNGIKKEKEKIRKSSFFHYFGCTMELPSTHVKKSLIRYTYIHNHCIPELLFLKTVERIMGTTFENLFEKLKTDCM